MGSVLLLMIHGELSNLPIRSVAILGANRDSVSLACYLVKHDIVCYLFDVRTNYKYVNLIANNALSSLSGELEDYKSKIITANYDDNYYHFNKVDLIIDCNPDNAKLKAFYLNKISQYLNPNAIVIVNAITSDLQEIVSMIPEYKYTNLLGIKITPLFAESSLIELSIANDIRQIDNISNFFEKLNKKLLLIENHHPLMSSYNIMIFIQTIILSRSMQFRISIDVADDLVCNLFENKSYSLFKLIEKIGLENFIYQSMHLSNIIQDKKFKRILALPSWLHDCAYQNLLFYMEYLDKNNVIKTKVYDYKRGRYRISTNKLSDEMITIMMLKNNYNDFIFALKKSKNTKARFVYNVILDIQMYLHYLSSNLGVSMLHMVDVIKNTLGWDIYLYIKE